MALLPQDIDTASDVYIVRAGGGFPNPEPESPCVGEGCQGPDIPSPAGPPPPFSGPGNLKVKGCKKGFVKKKGQCVKKNKGKRHKKNKGTKKRAATNQGGKK
jgi:hypothetical protein